MIQAILAAAVALALFGCAPLQPAPAGGSTQPPSVTTPAPSSLIAGSPEAQIVVGARTVEAATVTVTGLLRANKITVDQATSYRILLGAGQRTLNNAGETLEKCRTMTGSNPRTTTDPCRPQIEDVVKIALDTVAAVKRAVDAR